MDTVTLSHWFLFQSLRDHFNNFNSYLAILSAIESSPVSRLDWPDKFAKSLEEPRALIDNKGSFKNYREAFARAKPPCIPYMWVPILAHTHTPSVVSSPLFLPQWALPARPDVHWDAAQEARRRRQHQLHKEMEAVQICWPHTIRTNKVRPTNQPPSYQLLFNFITSLSLSLSLISSFHTYAFCNSVYAISLLFVSPGSTFSTLTPIYWVSSPTLRTVQQTRWKYSKSLH